MLDISNPQKNYKFINIFIASYLSIFLVIAIISKNFEFAGYILFYSILFSILNWFCERFLIKYNLIYFSISLFLILHLLGGLVHFGSDRLYDTYVFGLLKYDWIIHTIGGFLCAIISFDILRRFFDHRRYPKILLFIVIVLLASGIGSLNEILEYFAVVFLNAGKAVGNYANNAQDLVNNTLGAIIGAILVVKSKYFK